MEVRAIVMVKKAVVCPQASVSLPALHFPSLFCVSFETPHLSSGGDLAPGSQHRSHTAGHAYYCRRMETGADPTETTGLLFSEVLEGSAIF
jgi:hypothetical protein